VFDPASPNRSLRRGGALIAAAGALALPAAGAAADGAGLPSVPSGYSISLFAQAPMGASSPDDICVLDGRVFVAYQNGVGPNGEPNAQGGTASTIVEYRDNGSVAGQWSVTGKVDGLGADPREQRVIATLNEDSNSSLVTISPFAPAGDEVVSYTYSPSPSPSSGSGPLLTGGGTDSVTVLPDGAILVAASNPQTLGADPTTIFGGPITATFRVHLTRAERTATLAPTFLDDSEATLAPADSTTVKLDLSDPDSNAYVPPSSPLYARQFMQVSQGDHELIFVRDITGAGAPFDADDLTTLPLSERVGDTTTSAGVDDVRWVAGERGTLYVVDDSGGDGGNGAIYAIRGPFTPGEALAAVSETGAPNSADVVSDGHTVDTLDLATGVLTPFATGFEHASGEAWTP